MTEYCRLCAELKEPDDIVASLRDAEQSIEPKLRACCQWTAENMDHQLPHSVCSNCFDKLEKCWLFAQCVQSAQQRLLEIFDKYIPSEVVSAIKVENETETEPEMEIEIKPLATEVEQLACDFEFQDDWSELPSPPSNIIPTPSPKDETQAEATTNLRISEPIESNATEPTKKKKPLEYIYKCKKCGKMFQKKWGFREHVQRHSKHRPFECWLCHKTFKLKYSLRNHMVIHVLSPKTRRENRIVRMQKKNQKPKERVKKLHSCLECGKTFWHQRSMKEHQDTKHSNVYSFECCLCHKIFKTRRMLRSHVMIHVQKRPAKNKNQHDLAQSCICELCGRTFKTRAHLNGHLQTFHSDERPFKCDVCGLGYKMKRGLKAHQVMHTEYQYKCTHCDKEFRKKVSLRKHMEYHRGPVAKPFVCEFCGKGFRFNANYSEHRRLHTGETPYECEYCSSKFRTMSSFYTHLKKAHGIAKSVLNIEQRARITAMSTRMNDPPPVIPK